MNYRKLTKDQLIERLRELESRTAPDDSKTESSIENALVESKERLQAILHTAVEGIITIDTHGKIESANPAVERIFGYKSSELIGQNVNLLMPSPYHEEHDQYLRRYLETGKARIIGIGRELIGKRKDGSLFPMDLAVSEVKLKDKRRFTGFIRDITDRKNLEQEIARASEMEQRRIGQDLHDGLCQHLAGIEFMSQVLEENLLGRSRAAAESAAEITRLVRQAIAQTRDLAKGLSPVLDEPEGLMKALESLSENVSQRFGLKCWLNCEHPVYILENAASTHLFRIAQEAVNNAIRHGRATRIVIQIRLINGEMELGISDNGKGIGQSDGHGEGMGLKIMGYRANTLGGTLCLQPSRDGGCRVSCVIPPMDFWKSASPLKAYEH